MVKQRKKTECPAKPKVDYKPTPKDKALVAGFIERRRQTRRAPKVKADQPPGGDLQIGADHPDDYVWGTMLQEIFGTVERDFANEQLISLINTMRNTAPGPVKAEAVNAGLALINGIAPKDEIEAALETQMAATNQLALELIRQTRQAEYMQNQQIYGNLATKFMRTFSAQLEALQRYRGKGQQKIVVERVNVSDGGQAIVGHVEQGSAGVGSSEKSEHQSHAKQTGDASLSTLRSKDETGNAV